MATNTSTHHERRLSRDGLRARLHRYYEQGILGYGLVALAISHLADAITTAVAIAHPLIEEGVPTTAAIFGAVGLRYGIPLWTAYKLGGPILIAAALYWLVARLDRRFARPAVHSFYGLMALLALVVAARNIQSIIQQGAI